MAYLKATVKEGEDHLIAYHCSDGMRRSASTAPLHIRAAAKDIDCANQPQCETSEAGGNTGYRTEAGVVELTGAGRYTADKRERAPVGGQLACRSPSR